MIEQERINLKRSDIIDTIRNIFLNIDKYIALIGVVVSISILLFGILTSSGTTYYIVGGLLLIVCLVWLMYGSRLIRFPQATLSSPKYLLKVFSICFFILLTLSIVALYLRLDLYERPVIYILILVTMAALVGAQCVISKARHSWIILAQTISLGIALSWSQTLIFPGLNGVDSWYHYNIIRQMLEISHIPEGFSYSYLPTLHLSAGVNALITNTSLKYATLLTTTSAQIIGISIFIFIIARSLFGTQIGLLASLLAIVNTSQIQFSYLIYPNAFGIIFILIIIYITIVRYNRGDDLLAFSALLILAIVTTVLTHSIVAAFASIVIFLIWGSTAAYSRATVQQKSHIPITVPLFSLVTMLSWWIYISGHWTILMGLIQIDFNPDIVTKGVFDFGNISLGTDLLDTMFSVLPAYLFIILSILGIFYMISRNGNRSTVAYASISITPLIIPFVFFISGGTAITERWILFAQILLSVPLSLVILSAASLRLKGHISKSASIFLIILFLCSLSFTSMTGNHDNFHFPPQNKLIIYKTQSELTGYNYITDNTEQTLAVDGYSIPVIRHCYGWNDYERIDQSLMSGDFADIGGTLLIRTNVISNFQRMNVLSSDLETEMSIYLQGLNYAKIYDNRGISCYY